MATLAAGIGLQAEIIVLSVTSAASFEPGIPPKGSIATLFCRGLRAIESTIAASAVPLPRELAGVRVIVGGALAPLFAVAAFPDYQQINFQVPHEAVFVNDRAEAKSELNRVKTAEPRRSVSGLLQATSFGLIKTSPLSSVRRIPASSLAKAQLGRAITLWRT